MTLPLIQVRYPDWFEKAADWELSLATDAERMHFVIDLARRNVEARTGGPFGAAVFERDSGRLVGAGVNLVVRSNNAMLHGEVVALMVAQARLRTFSLRGEGMPAHELFTSCETCAMCLGAVLWSGVQRLVYAALREDAVKLRFDEGPVFPESYQYLRDRGVEVVAGVEREAAVRVLEQYRQTGGPIYNA